MEVPTATTRPPSAFALATASTVASRDGLKARRQGDGTVRQLLPDLIPGVLIDRMEIPVGGRIPGVPHMPGTREYFNAARETAVGYSVVLLARS